MFDSKLALWLGSIVGLATLVILLYGKGYKDGASHIAKKYATVEAKLQAEVTKQNQEINEIAQQKEKERLVYVDKIVYKTQTLFKTKYIKDYIHDHNDTIKPFYSLLLSCSPSVPKMSDTCSPEQFDATYQPTSVADIVNQAIEYKTELLQCQSVATGLQDWINTIREKLNNK